MFIKDLVLLKDLNFMLFFIKLIDNFEVQYQYVVNDGLVFMFFMNKNVLRYKVLWVDFNNFEVWLDVIFELQLDVFISVICVNKNQLFVCYMQDVKYLF